MKISQSVYVWLMCIIWVISLNSDFLAASRYLSASVCFGLYVISCYLTYKAYLSGINIHWSARIAAILTSTLIIFTAWALLKEGLTIPESLTHASANIKISYYMVTDHIIAALIAVFLALPLAILFGRLLWIPSTFVAIGFLLTNNAAQDILFSAHARPLAIAAVANVPISISITLSMTVFALTGFVKSAYPRVAYKLQKRLPQNEGT